MSVPLLPATISLSGVTTPASSYSKDTPEKIHDAASQFESILIGQILKTTQSDNGEGWLGDNEDQAASSAMDFATDFFARAIASHGGLGLTRMISSSLERASNPSHAIPNQPPADTPSKD